MLKTPLDFHRDVESLVSNGSSYMDAILHWCEVNHQEVESIAEIIMRDQTSLSKLQEEAERLNFLKPIARLPL